MQLYADTRKKCQAIIKKRSKDFGGTSDAPDVMKLVLEILTTNTNVKLKQKKNWKYPLNNLHVFHLFHLFLKKYIDSS